MSAINNLRRAVVAAVRSGTRGVASYGDIVSGPPKVRISFTEKVIHGCLITFGFMAYPIYAIYEVAQVRKEEYAALEIPEEWQEWKEKQKN